MTVVDHALAVPIQVDILTVDPRTVTAGPMADFSRLPFHDGRRDVNPGRAYLAETVVDSPFEEAAAWLAPGVHLHWALPEALTRGRHRPGADVEFPRVPDRWLVGAGDDWWVVESDYLHPEGVDASAAAISYLMPPGQRVRAPFRHLGRQVPLADWRPVDPDARYLDGLTAVGWGHPAFHAFYPNCRSVFGFHHPGEPAAGYRVLGWYSRPGDDPVAAYAAAHRDASDAELVAGLAEEFRWQGVPSDERPVARPTRLLCVGQVGPAAPEPVDRHLDHVVLGATGAEALAAHLADLQHPHTARHLSDGVPSADLHEEALESILLASRLDPDRPDAVAALREARHDKEFVGVPGGAVWAVRARSRGLPADAAGAPSSAPGSAPAAAAARLAELNRLQHRRDVLDRQQDVQSAQLHADWCRYQTCLYPARGDRLDHPDVDELRRHIEVTALAALETTVVESDRVTHELAAVAAEILGVLATEDAAACEIRAQDVLDWPGLAAAAGAAQLLSRARRAGLVARPDDDAERSLALVELNDRVRADRLPAELRPGGVDPTVRAWVYGRGLDDVTARSVARLVGALFPRPEHAEAAARFGAALTAQAGAVLTVQRHRTILELLLPGVLAQSPRARHELDLRPGPRFWRPRDPVLLLAGSAVSPTGRHPRRGDAVLCGVVPLGEEPATGLAAVLDRRGPDGSPIASEIVSTMRRAGEGGDWHPIMLDWKVALHEEPGPAADGPGHHDADHVTGRYELRENRPDLTPLDPEATTGSPRATHVAGRSLLSPHPGRELRHALDTRSAGRSAFVTAVAEQAAAYLDTPAGTDIQAVSLAGLNAALLMHEPVLPVGIDDPLAFPEARAFAARVASAIGRHTRDAPRPQLHFSPIRAGRLQIVGLRVVDSFGRIWPDPQPDAPRPVPPRLHSSEALPAAMLEDEPVFSLPPRLVPPARLRMRWLAAGTRTDEAHDHPTTGPVCGWLVPNVLDDRIMVHGADGEAVGSIDVPGRWRPAPGRDRIVPPQDIDDPHLRRVVVHLLGDVDRQDLLETWTSALEEIMPDAHAQHRAVGLLMGRPIAVVRAGVRLEVLGALPVDQSWAELRSVLAGAPRSTAGLEDVRFPLRLGEHGLLDDGLVGFWVERGEGFEDGRFHTPVDAARITLTVDGPPMHLTMLMDPRGSVHATTGILPTKVLRIPPEQYGPVLNRIGVTFLTAPLLTDPDLLRVALPPEPGHRWSWLERTDTGWREVPAAALGRPRSEATFAGVQELREGWLRLAPVPDGEADG